MHTPKSLGRALVFALIIACLASVTALAGEAGKKFYTLTVIHTNDFHDYDPDALAKKAVIVQKIRSEAKNVILLDAGDIFSRGKYHKVLWGTLEIAAMNATGYDAWTLGNNEFKCDVDGPSSLKRIDTLVKQATFPTLCGNISLADGTAIPGVVPFIVKEVGGLRIGVFGVTNSNKVKNYPQASVLKVTDCVEAAAKIVPQMATKADIVIELSHAGLALDLQTAGSVKGISAIISADDHTIIPQPIEQNSVPIVQAGGENRQYIGRLDLTFEERNGAWQLSTYGGRLYEITKDLPFDPAIQQIVDEYVKLAKAAA